MNARLALACLLAASVGQQAAGGVREESSVVASLRRALAAAGDGETVVVPAGAMPTASPSAAAVD